MEPAGKDSASVKIGSRNVFALWGLLVVSSLAGCGGAEAPQSNRASLTTERDTISTPRQESEPATAVRRNVSSDSRDAGEVSQAVLPRLALPPIHLSSQHEATCVVKQGDALPDFELQDAEGKSHRLSSLFGDRLTAVCFWSGKSPAAVQQLQDMGPEILDAFAEQGLAVIAINYGQSAAVAKRVAEQTGFTSPLLLDPRGAAFSQVATRHLPRTYLLDREGKVVWFDLEYSPSTRRHLRQAIEYTLSQP